MDATTTAAAQETPRERLRRLALAAGYGRDALAAIADAALHMRHPAPGEPMPDPLMREICNAVEVLTEANRTEAQVLTRIAGFRDAGGEWRYAFWGAEMKAAAQAASARAADPPTSQPDAEAAGATATAEQVGTLREYARFLELTAGELFNAIVTAAGGSAAPEDRAAAQLERALERVPAATATQVIETFRGRAAQRIADARADADVERAAA